MRKTAVLMLFIFAIAGASWALTPAQKRAALQKLKLKDLKDEGNPEPSALPRFQPMMPMSPGQGMMMPPPVAAKPKPERLRTQPALEAGLSFGYFANVPAAVADLRWHNIMEWERVSARTGVIYAQGEDTDKTLRKHALLFLDGTYRLDSMGMRGAGTYAGAGVNYLVYTSGRVSGTWAGQVYVGLDSRIGRREVLYVELGYGYIRTGFSPTYRGLNAALGYRWSL
ncbi:hypothetical protein HZC35_01490 [Candidatus Saganbacteria bacterium]|nr:hypothetical protein [Candidatus Saganbacteria bacterium]